MSVKSEELIAVRDAAKECSRTTETIRRWIWEGKLPAQKLGNQLFIKRNDLLCMASRLKGREPAPRLAVLGEARAVRERIYGRLGSNLDVLEALDRSRESHP
ncbi:MAG: helix-turn-helix domain-containing protein [Dehalococcoidia bacterium]|nr:helix-turn-helix domain-containing protein [Dehalococcoidia bacterium]